MVRIGSVALVAVLSCSLGASGWAEELALETIVQRHIEAKGGLEAIHAIRSLSAAGQYTAFGDTAPFVLERARPQLYRFDHRALGTDMSYAFDGAKAWWINPGMGYDWAVDPPNPERRFIYSEALFDDPLIDHEARGIALKAAGPGEIDGFATVTVLATLPDGSEETWHLDPATWLEYARISTGADFGRAVPCRTFYSEFEKVLGVAMPHRIEQEYSIRFRVFDFESIRANATVEPSRFSKPIEPEIAALAGLAGRWEVAVESVGYPGGPTVATATSSTIQARYDGRLFVEEISLDTAGGAFWESRTLAWDRFRKRYVLTVHDDVSAHPNILIGSKAEDGTLVFDNLSSETPLVVGETKTHVRYTLTPPGADGFSIAVAVTQDGGAGWFEAFRTTYRPPTTPPEG